MIGERKIDCSRNGEPIDKQEICSYRYMQGVRSALSLKPTCEARNQAQRWSKWQKHNAQLCRIEQIPVGKAKAAGMRLREDVRPSAAQAVFTSRSVISGFVDE
jgi:hypothetical protein